MDEQRITFEANESLAAPRADVEEGSLPDAQVSSSEYQKDREHLTLLSIYHFIFCGIQCVGLVVLPLDAAFMITMFSGGGGPNAPPPEIGYVFAVICGLLTVLILAETICVGLTGYWLRKPKHRTFCFITSCLICLSPPVGTILGVFTIIVLLRESVKRLFQSGEPPPEMPTKEDPSSPYEPPYHTLRTRQQDKVFLGLLTVFHLVVAAFFFGLCLFTCIYVTLGVGLVSSAAPTPGGGPSPYVMGWFFIVMFGFLAIVLFTHGTIGCLAAYNLHRRKRWLFCMVASGIVSTQAPIGTALGGFSILVLMRQSVKDLFRYGEPVMSDDEDYQ
jgi:hypothetical protein